MRICKSFMQMSFSLVTSAVGFCWWLLLGSEVVGQDFYQCWDQQCSGEFYI